MEIVWQSSAGTTRPRKLKAPCEGCRARKKRCFHLVKDRSAADIQTATRTLPPPRASRESSTQDSTPYFGRIGDYAPESILEHISSTTASSHAAAVLSPNSPPSPLEQQVNLLSPAERATLAKRVQRRRHIWYKTLRRELASPVLSTPYRQHLEDSGAFLALPSSTTNALLGIYISTFDDLIPIVDGASVFRDVSNGKASIYLVRAICLVTCKIPHAAPHLHLEVDGPLLSYRCFASKLLAGLDTAMRASLETDRLTRIRIYALMHLYNDGPHGRERSSMFLSTAIGEAWAMALHHDVLENGELHGEPHRTASHMLWWTLRNLDRLNKLIMGVAPFMIEDSDIGIEKISSRKDNYRFSLMALSTALGDLTATSTKAYKAKSAATTDDTSPFPEFADITAESLFAHFLKGHQAYLELWYHLSSMMSCRHGGPGGVTYARRLKSADQVIAILGHKGHVDLPPLPLVPYVLSIATTVLFRAIRDGQRSPQAGLSDVSQCCDALDDLSQYWTSATGVAKLSRRLLDYLKSTLHLTQNNDEVEQSDRDSSLIRPVQVYPNSHRIDESEIEATQSFDQQQWSQNWTPSETIQDVLMNFNMGQGFNDLAFDVFADLEYTGFIDPSNGNYHNGEAG